MRDVRAGIAEIEPLMQSLRAAANDDDLLAFELVDTLEFRGVHEPALAQLFQLEAERECVEVVLSHNNVFLNVCCCSWREGALAVSYTHLRAHETDSYIVCRLLLEKK